MSKASRDSDQEVPSVAPESVSKIASTITENSSTLQKHYPKTQWEFFLQWSRFIAKVIRGKGKISFIDGSSHHPLVNDSLYSTWDSINLMVVAWIIHSEEDSVAETYLFYCTAKKNLGCNPTRLSRFEQFFSIVRRNQARISNKWILMLTIVLCPQENYGKK